HHVHYTLTAVPQVGLCGLPVILEYFAEHQLVGVSAEGVSKHGHRMEVHVAVGAFRLKGTRAIKVPLR
ncbi:hypothetical protein QMK92_29515, partial [Klebsiella pneumoniae]